MKNLNELNTQIKTTYSGFNKIKDVDFGNGCLGWTHASDTTLENATWIDAAYTGSIQASASEIINAQKNHPRYMDFECHNKAYTTKNTDSTDFSTASDWVFLLDMTSLGSRSGATKTLTGNFVVVPSSGSNYTFKNSITLNVSDDGDNILLSDILIEAGCKIISVDDTPYLQIPSKFVQAPWSQSQKSVFMIKWNDMLGDKIRLYNKCSENGELTGVNVLPVVPVDKFNYSTISE